MRTEVQHLHGAREVLEPIEVVRRHAEQLALIKIEHIEPVEVLERNLDIIVHREVAKPIAEQHLVAVPLGVEHPLQDIAVHVVMRQEHLPIEALAVELEATVVVLERNLEAEAQHQVEALTDQVVPAEAAGATVHQVAHREARVAQEAQAAEEAQAALEVQVVLLALHLAAEDHLEEDLVVVEAVNKALKFH